MFRSEDIDFYNIIFSKENANQVLNELGSLGFIEILDTHE